MNRILLSAPKRFCLGAVALATLGSASLHAQSVNYFHRWGKSGTPEGAGGYLDQTFIDFTDAPAAGRETFYGTGVGNNVDWNLAFRELRLSNETTTGYCVEMTALQNGAVTPNADLTIWSKGYVGQTNSEIISDDYNGSLMPKVRIWVQATTTTTANARMFVAAFNTSHNNAQFYLQFYRLAGKTESSCTTAQGVTPAIPWVKVKGAVWSRSP